MLLSELALVVDTVWRHDHVGGSEPMSLVGECRAETRMTVTAGLTHDRLQTILLLKLLQTLTEERFRDSAS